MTDHFDRLPRSPGRRPAPVDHPAATRYDAPWIAAAVPIAVWRLDDHNDRRLAAEPGAEFGSRLARRLVLTYTRHGDTVVAFDDDAELHQAAAAAGRRYLTLAAPESLSDLDRVRQPVGLVTLRWPRQADPTLPGQVADLLAACRPLLGGDACVVAVVRPTDADKPDGTFADHERTVRLAAEAAGLRHVQQIAVVSSARVGDRLVDDEAPADEVAGAADRTTQPAAHRVAHIDLLVFTRDATATAGPVEAGSGPVAVLNGP